MMILKALRRREGLWRVIGLEDKWREGLWGVVGLDVINIRAENEP
jgi:hypothetical protein